MAPDGLYINYKLLIILIINDLQWLQMDYILIYMQPAENLYSPTEPMQPTVTQCSTRDLTAPRTMDTVPINPQSIHRAPVVS